MSVNACLYSASHKESLQSTHTHTHTHTQTHTLTHKHTPHTQSPPPFPFHAHTRMHAPHALCLLYHVMHTEQHRPAGQYAKSPLQTRDHDIIPKLLFCPSITLASLLAPHLSLHLSLPARPASLSPAIQPPDLAAHPFLHEPSRVGLYQHGLCSTKTLRRNAA